MEVAEDRPFVPVAFAFLGSGASLTLGPPEADDGLPNRRRLLRCGALAGLDVLTMLFWEIEPDIVLLC